MNQNPRIENQRQTPLLAVILISAAACLLYAFNAGVRFNYGVLRGAIEASSGVSYANISFILAVAQVTFGVAQPLFGMLALKKSNSFVLLLGAAASILALIVIPMCKSFFSLLIFLGFVLPAGPGALSFGVIMGAITPMLGERRAAFVSGLVNASSGFGTFVFSPILQRILAAGGLRTACLFLAAVALVAVLVSLFMGRTERSVVKAETSEHTSIGAMLKDAFSDRNYRLLVAAFATCGYQMAIIETHFYSQITGYGFSESLAAYALSIYGIATIAAGVLCGFAMNRFPMKIVLGTTYALRTVGIALFLLAPKTLWAVYLFAVLLGVSGGPTVPPTSGLIGKFFGSAKIGTLLGVAFLFHQIGSFFSAWIGGIMVESTGGYDLLWVSSAVLAALAATASYRVKE